MSTIQEIVDLQGKGLQDTQIVQQLIQNDFASFEKREMGKEEAYYNGMNDVMLIDFRKYTVAGVELSNDNRSNRHVSHNFLEIIISQLVDYALGKGIGYSCEDEKYQAYLDDKLMFDFNETMSLLMEESRIKGKAYLHFYYGKDGILDYAVVPAQEIIPIYKDKFKHELSEVIRYYLVQGIDQNGKPVLRHAAEWWNSTEVRYYKEDENDAYILQGIPPQPAPHWFSMITSTPDEVEANSWGRVPFIELRSGYRAISDLKNIKLFVDSYDLIVSEFVNQIADVREILIKVLGYSGTDAAEILKAFRATGIVKIDSKDGDIDVLKTEIPVEARTTALKILQDNIYKMGKGVDTNPEKYGTAIAGIAIRMMYKPLDLKADTAILNMRKAVLQFMWFITDDYNRLNSAKIDSKSVEISFNKNTIEDTGSIVDSAVKLKGTISDKTIREMIPGIDPAQEDERMEEQDKKNLDAFNAQVMQDNQGTPPAIGE
jgi:SPP1 family phage portal protein